MDRRSFLQTSGAGLALSAFPVSARGAEPGAKPLRVGLIGCGWYGKCDLFRLLQVAPVEVVSLCDVDKNMLADAAEQVSGKQVSKKKPRIYGDYRDMLKEKDLDVVMVETPDHWHALPMIAACEAGADVWVQKPISVDVVEGQAMVVAARKHNKVVQSSPSGGVPRTWPRPSGNFSTRANSARSAWSRPTATILYASRSDTLSHVWNLWVIRVASFSRCFVGRSAKQWSMASWNFLKS
ncbi:Myo-inositol 2-dehydrogenase [Fimbriiglobus ruber]|uniref:Myo-inositol 2-dehydrogenase n=1 Tax=Fimbriiglobus ruber TaxID=1908690 RepID=A0A225DBL2_9BACT|nr:Myo-inositol 2-dehydrogenase [Fimbriiglobus ruber]